MKNSKWPLISETVAIAKGTLFDILYSLVYVYIYMLYKMVYYRVSAFVFPLCEVLICFYCWHNYSASH